MADGTTVYADPNSTDLDAILKAITGLSGSGTETQVTSSPEIDTSGLQALVGQLQDAMANNPADATSGQYTKESAVNDVQGLLQRIASTALNSQLPSIAAGEKGAGLYNSSTQSLLANNLQGNINASQQEALQNAIKNYASIAAQQGVSKTNQTNALTAALTALANAQKAKTTIQTKSTSTSAAQKANAALQALKAAASSLGKKGSSGGAGSKGGGNKTIANFGKPLATDTTDPGTLIPFANMLNEGGFLDTSLAPNAEFGPDFQSGFQDVGDGKTGSVEIGDAVPVGEGPEISSPTSDFGDFMDGSLGSDNWDLMGDLSGLGGDNSPAGTPDVSIGDNSDTGDDSGGFFGGDFGDFGDLFGGGADGSDSDLFCVTVDMKLADGHRAGDVNVGTEIVITDPYAKDTQFNTTKGPILDTAQREEECIRIETENGSVLECSLSAPIPTMEFGFKPAVELRQGSLIATTHRSGIKFDKGTEIEWSRVTELLLIGPKMVQKIHVANRAFWAGEDGKMFILHHNDKWYDE